MYDMLQRPKTKKTGEKAIGDGWCGGGCRWGTFEKIRTLNRYAKKKDATVYVGLAANETNRLETMETFKRSPIAEMGMTEADCLEYCRQRDWNWLEETPATESGYVDLYDILDRVSCWCCCNKNQKELRNIWKYLPHYFERLKELQGKIDKPMKNWKNKKYGEYGNVFTMEKIFELEGRK